MDQRLECQTLQNVLITCMSTPCQVSFFKVNPESHLDMELIYDLTSSVFVQHEDPLINNFSTHSVSVINLLPLRLYTYF